MFSLSPFKFSRAKIKVYRENLRKGVKTAMAEKRLYSLCLKLSAIFKRGEHEGLLTIKIITRTQRYFIQRGQILQSILLFLKSDQAKRFQIIFYTLCLYK